jgi:hypothetical protein
MMRKKFLSMVTGLMMVTCAFAQDIPAGIRMEIVESDDDSKDQYSIFQYKDKNGDTGYYMGVAYNLELLSLVRDDITNTSFSHIDEVCFPMGTTRDQVIENLESYLELLDKPVGTTVEFPCRLTTGAGGLGEESTATCIVVKRFLQSKRLCFHFTSGKRSAEADLLKSSIKSMRLSVKLDKKLHPDKD